MFRRPLLNTNRTKKLVFATLSLGSVGVGINATKFWWKPQMSKLCLKYHGIDHLRKLLDGDDIEGFKRLEESCANLTKANDYLSVPIKSNEHPLSEFLISNGSIANILQLIELFDLKLSPASNHKIVEYLLTSGRLNDRYIKTIIENDNASILHWRIKYVLKDNLARYLSNGNNNNETKSNIQLFRKWLPHYDHETKIDIIQMAITKNLHDSRINDFSALTDVLSKFKIDPRLITVAPLGYTQINNFILQSLINLSSTKIKFKTTDWIYEIRCAAIYNQKIQGNNAFTQPNELIDEKLMEYAIKLMKLRGGDDTFNDQTLNNNVDGTINNIITSKSFSNDCCPNCDCILCNKFKLPSMAEICTFNCF